jgi:hypothetical protein
MQYIKRQGGKNESKHHMMKADTQVTSEEQASRLVKKHNIARTISDHRLRQPGISKIVSPGFPRKVAGLETGP